MGLEVKAEDSQKRPWVRIPVPNIQYRGITLKTSDAGKNKF